VCVARLRRLHSRPPQDLVRFRWTTRLSSYGPGSIDLLSPDSSVATATYVYVAWLPPAVFPPPHVSIAMISSGNKGENAPATQASACVSRLIQRLLWRCSRHLFCRMLDRTLSYHNRFGAKWRAGFRRKEWS
jgi:hypothetical protein